MIFKGLNDPAQNGVLSATVPGGLPAGVYKVRLLWQCVCGDSSQSLARHTVRRGFSQVRSLGRLTSTSAISEWRPVGDRSGWIACWSLQGASPVAMSLMVAVDPQQAIHPERSPTGRHSEPGRSGL
jgi:hypothetical protein